MGWEKKTISLNQIGHSYTFKMKTHAVSACLIGRFVLTRVLVTNEDFLCGYSTKNILHSEKFPTTAYAQNGDFAVKFNGGPALMESGDLRGGSLNIQIMDSYINISWKRFKWRNSKRQTVQVQLLAGFGTGGGGGKHTSATA